jgi:hypothetical protein
MYDEGSKLFTTSFAFFRHNPPLTLTTYIPKIHLSIISDILSKPRLQIPAHIGLLGDWVDLRNDQVQQAVLFACHY